MNYTDFGDHGDDSGNSSPRSREDFEFSDISLDDLIQFNAAEENLFMGFSGCGMSEFAGDVSQSSLPQSEGPAKASKTVPSIQPLSPDDGYSSSISCSVNSVSTLQSNNSSPDRFSPISCETGGNGLIAPKYNNLPPVPRVVHHNASLPQDLISSQMGSIFAVLPGRCSNTEQSTSLLISTFNESATLSSKTHSASSEVRNYSSLELRKMRNRESARLSKEKQKIELNTLKNSLAEKDHVIDQLNKQIEEKDSLIGLLQRQNNEIMISMAQLQVKYNEVMRQRTPLVDQACETGTISSSRLTNLVSKRLSANSISVNVKPSKRSCLFAVAFMLLFNYGFFSYNSTNDKHQTGVVSRRLLNADDFAVESDKETLGNSGYVYDPRLFFQNKFSGRREAVKYDEIIDAVERSNRSRSGECNNQIHSNVTHSHRVTRDLTEAIKHHKKFNDKNSRFAEVDPTLRLKQLLLKSPNGVLMKSIYDMLSSWERKDDTVYMFALGSNEWLLPKSNGSQNFSSSLPTSTPKMSLVMPALNNSMESDPSAHLNSMLYNKDVKPTGLGFYMMQIDCIVMDTHLLPYTSHSANSASDTSFK